MIKCTMQVSYNILRKLVSRQILDVVVVCVYDLCEFTSVHRLFKHPHINRGVKLWIIPCICANYLSNSRTPVDMSEREKVNYVKGCMQYYNTLSEHCGVKYNQGLSLQPLGSRTKRYACIPRDRDDSDQSLLDQTLSLL